MIGDDRLEELEQLARHATPGPWTLWDDGDVGTGYPVTRRRRVRGGEPVEFEVESGHIANASHPDGAFIAATGPDVILELIAELRLARSHAASENQRP